MTGLAYMVTARNFSKTWRLKRTPLPLPHLAETKHPYDTKGAEAAASLRTKVIEDDDYIDQEMNK